MIDTHCHLNFKVFENNVETVIVQAKKAGVEKIIVPGTNLETSLKAVELAQKYKNVYAAVGIHPHHSNLKNQISKIKTELKILAQNNKVIAIGECGLDYYQYQKTKYADYQISEQFKQKQKEIFILQIKLALELKLPLIIHNREADNDLLQLLAGLKVTDLKGLRGVFHCFQGNDQLLNWAIINNFYLSVNGLTTYNKNMQTLVKKVSLGKLLTETDAPFLIPEPLKSRHIFPNTPQNVKIVVSRIAMLKGDSFLNVANQTSKNAIQLFKLIK